MDPAPVEKAVNLSDGLGTLTFGFKNVGVENLPDGQMCLLVLRERLYSRIILESIYFMVLPRSKRKIADTRLILMKLLQESYVIFEHMPDVVDVEH